MGSSVTKTSAVDPASAEAREEAAAFALVDQFNELERLRSQPIDSGFDDKSSLSNSSARLPLLPEPPASPIAVTARPVVPSRSANASTHDPVGWAWFAQWEFPTQFFIFSLIILLGIGGMSLRSSPSDPAPAAPSSTKKPPTRTLKPESFDWLNRLRETDIISTQLEKQFLAAQAFYRDYAVDEFLDYDPWQLDLEELVALRHFCDQGFFTVEREILLKLLEHQLVESSETPETPNVTGAAARLAAAVTRQETRLAGLQEAAALYRRGQEAPVMTPSHLTPEAEQALRAELVDRLSAVKHVRAHLDARLTEVQALLKARGR